MRWYVNDLSLQGQFTSRQEFLSAFGRLAELRRFGNRLYCTRTVGERPATHDATCRQAIVSSSSRDQKVILLAWLSKQGPFMEDDRQEEQDDYFEFEGYDVTDQGLGEAARRVRRLDQAGGFSFLFPAIDFARDPLIVQHGLRECPIGYVNVANVWTVDELEARVRNPGTEPTNWNELIAQCRLRFDRLTIPDMVPERLNRETFYPTVAKRIPELLAILQKVTEGQGDDGKLTDDALSLWQTHSQGDKAWFSDESDDNKIAFKNELSFVDPESPERTLFCPWHGKIKTPQFRIHFEWPIPASQPNLKVLYIGPKITKK